MAAPENGEQSVQRRSRKPSTATENRTRDKRDGEVVGCGAEPHRENQASKPLNFQASNCPCTPGTSATCHKDDLKRPQEMQEIQEMQERA